MAESKSQEQNDIEYFANAVNHCEKILFGPTLRDRRHKVSDDNRMITKCIGRIRSEWSSTSIGYGTGTVFEYNHKLRRAFVITCAHNISRLDEQKRDMPGTVYFERRDNTPYGSELNEEYKCDHFTAKENYSYQDQCPNDLAIISFIVPENDTFYDDLFTTNNENNQVIELTSTGNDSISNTFQIYGFPCNKSKYSKVKTGELWGMDSDCKSYASAAQIKTELYFRRSSNYVYFYNAIDTEPGQSGSAIFVSVVVNDITYYRIVGVHTGGTKKNGKKNWGIALNKSKISWLRTNKFSDGGKNTYIDLKALATSQLPVLGVAELTFESYKFVKGGISAKTYAKKVSSTTVGTAGSVVCGYGGSSLGATIGTFVLPGIGTAVGGAIGGILCSYLGNKCGRFASDSLIKDDDNEK